jgi:hypothetical protein
MNKITPYELQRSLMAFLHSSKEPGNAEKTLFAEDGFNIEAGSSVAEATFKKLRDGSWGLLVNSGRVRPGDKVLAITKAGKRSYKFVGKIVWSGNGVAITTINKAGAQRNPTRSGKATDRQISLAMSLVRKLVNIGGWFDSSFGDGMPPPRESDLRDMSSREISEFINELKSEF